jgi:hypothetical protein
VVAREQPGQHGQDRAIRPGKSRCPDLAPEHGDLVAQDEDLSVFGPIGPGEQGKPAEHAKRREISES